MLMKIVRPQRGFSMVEVAITMTVLALLLAAAAPSVAGWMRNTRVRNTAEALQMGLQRARAEALRRNVNVTFWLVAGSDERTVDNSCALSSASGSWVISVSDPTGHCATAPDPTTSPMIVETHAVGDGGGGVTVAALSAASAAARCVRFNGFGQVVDAAVPPADNCRLPNRIATVDVTHASGGARRLRIMVSAGGGVRMCDRDVSSTDPRACPA
jgi:type IV fimbrial biogenesis protein FimT